MQAIYAGLSEFDTFDDHSKEETTVNSKPVSNEMVGDKGQNYDPERREGEGLLAQVLKIGWHHEQ